MKLPCPRCSGSGYIPHYKHVQQGVCFLCWGNGGSNLRQAKRLGVEIAPSLKSWRYSVSTRQGTKVKGAGSVLAFTEELALMKVRGKLQWSRTYDPSTIEIERG